MDVNKFIQKKKVVTLNTDSGNGNVNNSYYSDNNSASGKPVSNGAPMNGHRPSGPNGAPMNGPRPAGPNGAPMNGPRPAGPNGAPMNGHRPAGPNGAPMNGPRPAGPNGALMNGHRPAGPNGAPMNGPRPAGPNGAPMNGPRPAGPNGAPMNGPRPAGPNGAPMNGPRPAGPNGAPVNGSKPVDTKNQNQKAPKGNKKGVAAKTDKPLLIGSIGRAGQYIGMCLIMFSFILMVPVVSQTGEEFLTENILMAFVVALCMVLGTVGYMTISVVLTAGAVVAFAAYKLYFKLVLQSNFYYVSYLWMIIPVIALIGIGLFVSGYSNLQLENALLHKQVSDLVMIDSVTGLYNLRSMFMDMQTQISYSERNDTQISLMIVRLRYPAEMKKVLKIKEYETAIKQLSLLLVDCVRLEDKVYSIDADGGFGIILTCGNDGTKIVEKRIRTKLNDPKWFANVSTRHQVRAEVKIGYLQYDKNKYDRNANSFKESVEKQVERDV